MSVLVDNGRKGCERDWNEAGVWQKLHELLLSELRAANLLDFSRGAVDSSHIRAMKGGPATGPPP